MGGGGGGLGSIVDIMASIYIYNVYIIYSTIFGSHSNRTLYRYHQIVASDCKWRSCEASPFGRATSWNSLWLVELLIVRLLDKQSQTTGGATTHEWLCDHTWLVVRPCKTCLRLVIADRSQTVLNMTVDWFCSYDHVRSPTTTTISGTFSLRFDSDSYIFFIITWSFGVTVAIVNMNKVYNLEQKMNHNWQ